MHVDVFSSKYRLIFPGISADMPRADISFRNLLYRWINFPLEFCVKFLKFPFYFKTKFRFENIIFFSPQKIIHAPLFCRRSLETWKFSMIELKFFRELTILWFYFVFCLDCESTQLIQRSRSEYLVYLNHGLLCAMKMSGSVFVNRCSGRCRS